MVLLIQILIGLISRIVSGVVINIISIGLRKFLVIVGVMLFIQCLIYDRYQVIISVGIIVQVYFIVVIGIRVNLICLFWVVFVISLIKFGCISIFVMVIVSDILVLNLMVVDVVIISGRKKKVLLLIIFRMVKVGDFFVSMLFILRIIVSSLIIDLLIIVGISGDMVLISVLRIFVLM